MREEEKEEHESFGMISFTRTNGIGQSFFGSEIKHDNSITLEIKTGEKYTSLSDIRYYGKKNILRARMTQAQFAELITSLNYNNGVPCTLELYNGKHIENLPFSESRKDSVHRKFQDRMNQLSNTLTETQKNAKNIVKKKTLSKDDQSYLINSIEYLTTEVSSNIPFFLKCFQEAMDHVVNDAKNEIEASIINKVTNAGLKVLFEEQQQLLLNKKMEE